MGHVVHGVLPRRGNEERAIRPFHERHHADEADVDPAGSLAAAREGLAKVVHAAAAPSETRLTN